MVKYMLEKKCENCVYNNYCIARYDTCGGYVRGERGEAIKWVGYPYFTPKTNEF